MPIQTLDNLNGLSREDLKALWAELYGRPAPPRFRRDLLLAFLAYRIQEKCQGGLSAAARRELRALSKAVGRNKDYRPASTPAYKPGTRLIRRWGREVHEVTILAEGYAYRGEVYRSLSEIARLITGTRWNGQAFFGQRMKKGKRVERAGMTHDAAQSETAGA
jgi:hypothetical protein